MVKVKLLYRAEEITLWDFAGQVNNQDETMGISYYEKAIFAEKVCKGRLVALCEALTDCEYFIEQIFVELDLRSSVRRWMNLKIFGTFEQLRTEMELRYPQAETVFLRTNDHKRIHGYWIPGRS